MELAVAVAVLVVDVVVPDEDEDDFGGAAAFLVVDRDGALGDDVGGCSGLALGMGCGSVSMDS